jgi:pimeloyl-ACP methyl ester carboxylesterase
MRTRTVGVSPPVTLREWGDGPPILFLHSMGPVSSGAIIGVGVGPLVQAGFSVTAPDLPGYGDTPGVAPDDYELRRLATWMWDVAASAGIDRIALVGHSWGEAPACHMHALHPERVEALVLVDSGHLDYADVLGEDLALTLDEWIERARGQTRRVADVEALAKEIDVDVDDPIVELFLVGMEYDDKGSLVSRVRPDVQGPALYHLAHARQTATWSRIATRGRRRSFCSPPSRSPLAGRTRLRRSGSARRSRMRTSGCSPGPRTAWSPTCGIGSERPWPTGSPRAEPAVPSQRPSHAADCWGPGMDRWVN